MPQKLANVSYYGVIRNCKSIASQLLVKIKEIMTADILDRKESVISLREALGKFKGWSNKLADMVNKDRQYVSHVMLNAPDSKEADEVIEKGIELLATMKADKERLKKKRQGMYSKIKKNTEA